MGNCQKDEDEIRSVKVIPAKSYLLIKCHTWKKDYQGLFDYESKEIEKEELKVNQSGVLLKEKRSNFGFVPCEQLQAEVMKAMVGGLKFTVARKPRLRGFAINTLKIQENGEVMEKSIWEVVKSMPGKKHILKEGDIIKLGRQKFKVKEKVLKEIGSLKQEEEKNNMNVKHPVYENLTKEGVQEATPYTEEESEQIVCRVCLDPGSNTNPIITPCKCQGYLKYIHLDCLKTWLGKRLEPSVKQYSVIINWKPLVCELCTSHFMYKVYLDGKKYYTVEIPRPDKPYIVLEILNKSNNNDKYYNLISFAEKQKLRLGRKHDIDIRISDDISVSRNHACIAFDPKTSQFTLEDNSSKFGTLVLQKRFRVQEQQSTMFQVGPNLFYVKMVKGLDEPVEDEYSESEKEKEEDNESYEESDNSEEDQEIQPEDQDLSPTVPKNAGFVDPEGCRPTMLMKEIPIPIPEEQKYQEQQSLSPSPRKQEEKPSQQVLEEDEQYRFQKREKEKVENFRIRTEAFNRQEQKKQQ